MEITILNDKHDVKRAMLATMGLKPKSNNELNKESWRQMLRGKHSPIEEYRIWIEDIVTERVHTHLVRHEEIGKYVATSRPDIKGHTTVVDGMRKIALSINAKRLIEIMEQRLCKGDVWCDTYYFFDELLHLIPDDDLRDFCQPPCVKYIRCFSQKNCGLIGKPEFKTLRHNFTR